MHKLRIFCIAIYCFSAREYRVFPFDAESFVTHAIAAFKLENAMRDGTPVYFLTYDEACDITE